MALKAELGSSSSLPAVAKLAGQRWRSMSPELRAPYEAPCFDLTRLGSGGFHLNMKTARFV